MKKTVSFILKKKKVLMGCPLLLIVLLGSGSYYLNARLYESTDDAFIESRIIAVSPKVHGQVLFVHVKDNQFVKKGELLVQIDPRDYQAILDQSLANLEAANKRYKSAHISVRLTKVTTDALIEQAQAGVELGKSSIKTAQAQASQAESEVAAAQAEATRTKGDLKRYQQVFVKGIITPQQIDAARSADEAAQATLEATRKRVTAAESQIIQARAQLAEAMGRLASANSAPAQIAVRESEVEVAAAAVAQAKAAVEQSTLNLGYTKIYAPDDGCITRKSVEPGNYVQVGQPLLAVVPKEVWVIANFKETQLTYMRPGQGAWVRVDAYPSIRFKAHVDSIQSGSGARFSLMPPENASGNFVKVVQRVPVKIVLDVTPDPQHLLGPGMSVEPEVKVR
jgi:membrane fusion protein, multidrug efflux system